jgi:hypothetical protein
MHYTTIDPPKVKDSNPRPCTTSPLTPKCQIFEPTTMQYTTIDPKRQKFEPKSMHYTTIADPRKDKDSNPRHALHNTTTDSQKVEDSNPRPYTTPPVTPKCQRFEPTTMHYTKWPNFHLSTELGM